MGGGVIRGVIVLKKLKKEVVRLFTTIKAQIQQNRTTMTDILYILNAKAWGCK